MLSPMVVCNRERFHYIIICGFMYVWVWAWVRHQVPMQVRTPLTVSQLPASNLIKTVGLVMISSQWFLLVGLKSSSVNCSSSANQLWSGDLCSPCCRWSSCLNWQCPPTSPSRKMSSRKLTDTQEIISLLTRFHHLETGTLLCQPIWLVLLCSHLLCQEY